jgi:hypothetical protein
VVVQQAAVTIGAAIPPHADSEALLSAMIPTKTAAAIVNSPPRALCAGLALASVTPRRLAADLVLIALKTRPSQMAMVAVMDYDAPAVNAHPEINSARPSWAAIPKATTRMLATTATASSAVQAQNSEGVFATAYNRISWMVLLVLVAVLVKT